MVGLYDYTGAVYCTYTYDPWGKVTSVKNASGQNVVTPTLLANIQPLRYRGYIYDNETGLYYLQSRYYDPVTRRFINADRLVSTGAGVLGFNMFTYCNNNPIVSIDLDGYKKNNYTLTIFRIICALLCFRSQLISNDAVASYRLDEAPASKSVKTLKNVKNVKKPR